MRPYFIHRPFRFIRSLGCLAFASATALLSAQILDPSDPEVQREIRDSFGPGATGAFQARNGMVTTSSHHATMAGLEALRAGGNAFDAMAVVQFVLAVAEPYASGIGGGLLVVGYAAETGEVFNLDGREEAPRHFHSEAFLDENGQVIPYRQRTTGGNSVGVPGTLAATAYLLENYGTISLEEALAPAIRLARDGFRVTESFAGNLRQQWDRIENYPDTVKLFSRPDGTPLRAGDLFRNPDLAATFELIAERGIGVFYEGEIAHDIVEVVQGDPYRPGRLTLEDLSNYRPVAREPVGVNYRGFDVYGMNMPSSGGVSLGLMLNVLEKSDFTDVAFGSTDWAHRLADVQNLVFADRDRYMGDADFADVPVAGLLAADYADQRRGLMRPDRALSTPVEAGVPEGAPAPRQQSRQRVETPSTTHFSIVDRGRNVLSVTSTIEQHFGSGILARGRGFLLNNELTDFEAEARNEEGHLVPNAPEGGWQVRRSALGDGANTEGGKRPRSSMTPTLVLLDGQPYLAVGSPGGSRIIGITLNVLLNILDHEMDVQQAINAPRVIARNGPLELEGPLHRNASLRNELRRRGFDVLNAQAVGAAQAIRIGSDGWLYGAADPRREGLAVGY
jgi:gamma-glutamyltranspeptidase / glutathione hydrolase